MIAESGSGGEEGVKVAIAQVDGKWPNLALAKVAAYHKAQLWSPLEGADVVYASKVFTDTPDDPYLPEDAIRGGSGYDLTSILPPEIEATKPDWSLWPWWTKDMGFTTRGCIRHCPFCSVWKREGKFRVVSDFAGISTGRSEIVLLDGNLTAAPMDHFRAVCEDATKAGVRLIFSQGLDARLFSDEHAAVLGAANVGRTIRFAFDHVADEPDVRRTVTVLKRAGFPASRLMFFVLIGYDSTPEEDMYRVEVVRSLGADPFVMRYDRRDPYQTRFSRWVNNMTAFNSMTWDEWLARFKTPLPDVYVKGAK